ncbi:serine/threonine protein kinase [Thalassoporum mexicanum PCC 7367]|nr:GUN4 domain-containing protein [Pseudanabaena sp. PCC 7367]AFY71311.1 serine/threonine protein kinase [Pseudanabaena sp. PCC 7367]
MLGQILDGRYKVVKELAAGGFAQTYLAEDMRLPGHPNCVVKHFNPAISDPYFLKKSLELFKAEAETLQRLGQHDQIPRLYAYFEEEQEFYLVQEFVAGHPLSSELLPGGKLPEPRVIKLVLDVLEILAYVHSCGVIHRDIKPDNLIRRHVDGKLVLIDFGTVKQIQNQLLNSQAHRPVTMPIGTPGFMPSEQEQGNSCPNSDIYALGMLALQALTGMHPSQFKRQPNGDLDWRSYVSVASISAPLAQVVDQMIAYEQTQRYQTTDQVVTALANLSPSSAIAISQANPGSLSLSAKVNQSNPSNAIDLPSFWAQGHKIQNTLTKHWRFAGGVGALAIALISVFSFRAISADQSVSSIPSPYDQSSYDQSNQTNERSSNLDLDQNLDQNIEQNLDLLATDRQVETNPPADMDSDSYDRQNRQNPSSVKATDMNLTESANLPTEIPASGLDDGLDIAIASPSEPNLLASAPAKFTNNLNYDQLRQSLAQQDWQSADRHTYELLLKAAGRESHADGTYHPDELAALSCVDVVLIDELWDDASGGKLGFSAQKRIYEAADQDWQKMYAQLGWRTISGTWLVDTRYDREASRWEYVDGHLPDFQAPPDGHLPIPLREASRQSFDHNEQVILRCL